ncbi:MAG: bifunctional [glutamate--ammonia ligase]-adenylyl-L-tyrosine phosphorylase/[glutamate--ammonia-ligase] adenylyltransferase, partial [Deltaproteobacteria bacterium]|nr:bifunctional [glutamate--ammonia ligase]-adenylyl-L-tyrosine phosphorylase/[glutamate--ammonia-ligase] adenylyltransferase [Deltaproteobacteria bacterium]
RAADWERLALIKLRAVAGNLEAGPELSKETHPFVFRRHLDYTAIEEMAALKAALAGRPRSPTLAGQDLKLDTGGIRQLEFFVQTLQLIYGGRRQRLRAAPTLEALARLAQGEIISGQDRAELASAYLFLRRAEHRLQLAGLTQTQTLPRRLAEMDRLGRAMGYGGPTPGRDFLDDLAVHTHHVSTRFEGLLAGPPAHRDPRPLASLLESLEAGQDEQATGLLATAGFIEPEKALNSLVKLTADGFLPQPLTRQRQLLAQILPALLDRVLASPDPDQALLRLERFLARMGPKTGLYLLLLENPAVAKLLVRIMATSAYLARVLTAHPGILDSLIDQRSQTIKECRVLRADLAETLGGAGGDEEEAAALIRRFKAEETVRIGVADLTGEMELELVSGQLSDLAETILAATLDLAASILDRRFQPADGGGLALAVLGLGKLGGRELAYHADLDVLFLYQAPPDWQAVRTDGRGGLQAGEYSIKLAQRIISLLSMSMAEGPGYEIDARLRPSGVQGPLVVSLDSFVRYHQTSALWERLALIKMRPAAGDEALGRAAEAAARQAAFERELPAGWVGEIQEMRARMGRERGAATGWDIKFGPGGLVEVELAVQTLQLGHGRKLPSLRTPQTLQALKALQAAGLIDQETHQDLLAGYRYLRNLDKRLRLLYDRGGDGVGYTEAEMGRAGANPPELDRIREGVDQAYRRVMTELLSSAPPSG